MQVPSGGVFNSSHITVTKAGSGYDAQEPITLANGNPGGSAPFPVIATRAMTVRIAPADPYSLDYNRFAMVKDGSLHRCWAPR